MLYRLAMLTRLAPLASVASLALLAGCNPHPIKEVAVGSVSTPEIPVPLEVDKKVDVLVVIDNSGSMGEEQANLAANFGPFIETLESAGADYRIGITTTDLGGPHCEGASSGGDLQLSSCLERPEDFVYAGTDLFDQACAASCALDSAALQVEPTAADSSGELAPRPWIESYAGNSNLGEGVDTLEAFQCFAPQGIGGCGWESPLEATSRALENMQDPSRPEHGFLRDDALLAVLIITDEVDCSSNPLHEDALFEAETFWGEGASYATSAVCWNAGVACSGDSPYEDCWDQGFDALGQPTTDPTQMMLHPVSSYVAQLEQIAADKLAGREVTVSVIAGVPQGYSSGEAEQVFADSPDPEFQRLFGIAPGCTNEVDGVEQTALPPVRLLSFASAFASAGLAEGTRNVYSVCDADYAPALFDIVSGIEVELPPACFPGCALDLEPDTDALEYSCEVFERGAGGDRNVDACVLGAAGWELPEGADLCWYAKTGDELADACVETNSNLEFELIRRAGVSFPGDTNFLALCEQSAHPSVDCG